MWGAPALRLTAGAVQTTKVAACRGPQNSWSSQSGRRAGPKRAFDALAAGMLLMAVLPVFLLIAIAIKLDSRGPVFYRCAVRATAAVRS
jgi:lipopolysaccharide/colanic/teichoic acid biosynthesis glycosyltransferase